MKVNDEAILIKKVPYSETSFILTFYTRNFGTQTYLYRGARKKASFLNTLGLYEIEFISKNDVQLKNITQITILEPLQEIYLNFQKGTLAFFIGELVYKLHRDTQEDLPTYLFLKKSIIDLNDCVSPSNFVLSFLIDFMTILGIIPNIESEDPNYFDLEEGVYTNKPSSHLKPAEKAILDLILGKDFVANAEDRKQIFNSILSYYQYHLHGLNQLKSLEIIREMMA